MRCVVRKPGSGEKAETGETKISLVGKRTKMSRETVSGRRASFQSGNERADRQSISLPESPSGESAFLPVIRRNAALTGTRVIAPAKKGLLGTAGAV
jgi:hypothetical protein